MLILGSTAAPPPPGYVAQPVHFDATTWIKSTDTFGHATDMTGFSMSFWFKAPAGSSDFGLLNISPQDFDMMFVLGSDGKLVFPYLQDTSTGRLADALSYDDWHHVLIFWGQQGVPPVVKIDGTTRSFDDTPSGGNDNLGFETGFGLPNDPDNFQGTPLTPIDMADFWLAINVVETDETKFRDATTGKPKDPTTFPTGTLLFYGGAAGFTTNHGTGGGTFTVTGGSLTDATTSPSD